MTNVKIQKIPMKDLSPKELAELAFDMGVTRGGSRTANTLKRGGLKRGAYGQGVGKYKDGGDVKYKGPLPKSKPKMTPIEKFTGKRSVNKSLSEEEKKYIGDKMAGKVVEKMEDGGAAIPSEFKGFSKLPEAVQVKMDPVAAKKYNGGGEVRGMGRAYMGSSRKAKIR